MFTPALLFACSVMVIGDSQAFMLQRPLAKQGHVEVCKEARPGSTALSWANSVWLRRLLARHEPSLLIVSVGTNDAGGIASRYKFPKNALRIVEIGHEFGAEVLWVIPPTNSVKTAHLDRWVEANITSDRLYDTRCLNLKIADKVHPGLKESRRWARSVWSVILHGGDPCAPAGRFEPVLGGAGFEFSF